MRIPCRVAALLLLTAPLAACAARGPSSAELRWAGEVALLPGPGMDAARAACVGAELAEQMALHANTRYASRRETANATALQQDRTLIAGEALSASMDAQAAMAQRSAEVRQLDDGGWAIRYYDGVVDRMLHRSGSAQLASPEQVAQLQRRQQAVEIADFAVRHQFAPARELADLAAHHAALFAAAARGGEDAAARQRLLRAVARAPVLEDLYQQRFAELFLADQGSCMPHQMAGR